MRFIDTYRASPVALKDDLPDKMDYFNIPFHLVDNKFIEEEDYVIDEEWWDEQLYRCLHGVYIPNAIEPGIPDDQEEAFLRDGIDVIWSNDNRDAYLPEYNLWMRDRCLYIPGRMYFYLNFWYIKSVSEDSNNKSKTLKHPMFTDLSWLNWITREAMIRFDKDNMWFKARQKGLSEEAAADVAFESLFIPNSQSIIVACEERYNENTMNMTLRGLDRMINTQFYKKPLKGHDRTDYKKNIIGSEIWSMTAKNNLQVLSGKTPSLVYVEEVGIWREKRIPELEQFINPSIINLGVKTGRINYIGTGGAVEGSIKDMEEMFYNPDNHNCMSFRNKYDLTSDVRVGYFVPVLAFKVLDKDGNSLITEANKKEEHDRLHKSTSARYKHIILNPKNPSELFNISSGGYFGPERSQWANDRKATILNFRQEQKEHRYRMEWINPKDWREGVRAIPYRERDGLSIDYYNLYMSEAPEQDESGRVVKGLYFIGTDSYDQDEAKTSSSKGASVVWKGFRNTNTTSRKFVAFLLERPTEEQGGREVFYENSAKLTVLFGTQNLIEHSKLLIFQWYESKGMTSLLCLKPEFTLANMVNKTQTTNKYGIDAAVLPHALKMLRDTLDFDTINKIDSVTLLNAIALFRLSENYNCDLTVSMAWAIVQYEDTIISYESNREAYEKQNQIRTLKYKRINGRLILTT